MSLWKMGVVHWFDVDSEEGSIIDKKDGMSYYVHASAIISKENEKKLIKGQLVEFKLYENLYMKQVDQVREPRKTKKFKIEVHS